MVMPGVETEPGGPSRACDKAVSHRSLNESLSAEEEREERTRGGRRKREDDVQCEEEEWVTGEEGRRDADWQFIQSVSLFPSESPDTGENKGCSY